MTLYELVFILLFLGSVIGLLLSAFLWRRRASWKILVAVSTMISHGSSDAGTTNVTLASLAFSAR